MTGQGDFLPEPVKAVLERGLQAEMTGRRACYYDKHRKLVRAKGIRAQFARRGTEHGSGLGVYR
ncbi:hypothetical protein [Saccharopolyspora shandongensis]|uniref:hypothetical protein n=1 Tax=Saccharopolyspora shandongensis TaxID=418495 RepID=UPI00340025CB